MKKFSFSLDTVLDYKQQVLDALKGEHAAALAKVHAQEDVLEAVKTKYRNYNQEYRDRKAAGMTITDAMMYQNGLRVLEQDIQRESDTLEQLRRQEEKKREEMVEAKKDTSSLEKLKEKKLESYQKSIQKGEELLVDEFISSARVRAAIGA